MSWRAPRTRSTALVVLLAGLAGLVALGAAPASASPSDLPMDKQAVVMLRILAYDRNLARRSGDAVKVAVVFRAGDAASEAVAADMTLVLSNYSGRATVSGLPIQVVSIPYRSAGLAADLQRSGANVVYLCPGLAGEAAAVAAATRPHGVLSFTEGDLGVRLGIAIGLVRRGDRIGILINLAAAHAERADLSSGLLRLAELIDERSSP